MLTFSPLFLYINMVYFDIPLILFCVLGLYVYKKHKKLILSFVIIAVACFLRKVGKIFLIAMVILYLFDNKEMWKTKEWIKRVGILLVSLVVYSVIYEGSLDIVRDNFIVGKFESYPAWNMYYMGINEAEFGFQDNDFSYDRTAQDVIDRVVDYGPIRLTKILTKKTFWLWTQGTYQAQRYAFGLDEVNALDKFEYETFVTKYLMQDSQVTRKVINAFMRAQYYAMFGLMILTMFKKKSIERFRIFYYTIIATFLGMLIYELKSRYILHLAPLMVIMAGDYFEILDYKQKKSMLLRRFKMNKRALIYSMIIVMLMVLVGCNNVNTDTTNTLDVVFNNNTALNVPTMINKIEDTYYIVDCYNNNILYSKELNEKLENWYRIPEEFHQPHSIIGDGKFFIVVDTENNRLVTFKKEKDAFIKLEEINEFGNRPHFGMFLENKYYIWDGIDTMYVYEERGCELVLDKSYLISSLSGTYVRSFSYIDEKWYFPTSNGKILVTDTNFEVVSEYTVPNNIAGLSYIYSVDEYWYVNIFTDINYDTSYANLVRCKNLEDLELEKYESLYEQFELVSAPYYVNYFDEAYYMATLNGKSAIYRLDIGEDGSIDCTQVF